MQHTDIREHTLRHTELEAGPGLKVGNLTNHKPCAMSLTSKVLRALYPQVLLEITQRYLRKDLIPDHASKV